MRWTSTADHVVSPKVYVFTARDDQMLDSFDISSFQLLVKILETGNFNVDTVKVAEAWRKYRFLLIFRNTLLYARDFMSIMSFWAHELSSPSLGFLSALRRHALPSEYA